MAARPDPKLYQRMADQVTDYAIFLLEPSGNIMSWNAGAHAIKQYSADEIIGRHFSIFYTDEDRARDWPAHELRNPLAPIRNAVQLQKAAGPGDPVLETARQIIERQSGQLSRIVDDLLDISRISRGKMAIERKPTDFAAVLTEHGHEAIAAHSGEEAVRLFAGYRPEVVLLDIGMPGMSGLGVARRMREMNGKPRPFIVAVTGWGTVDDTMRSREAGFDLHLMKPLEEGKLLEVFGSRLGSRVSQ